MKKYALYLTKTQEKPDYVLLARDKDEASTKLANLLNAARGQNLFEPGTIEEQLREV